MPKLGEIDRYGLQVIDVPSLPWLRGALNGGFVRGAVYLLAGGPGLGKTTLLNQVLGDMASGGRKVLYITTEQSLKEFKVAIERVHGNDGILPNTIVEHFYLDDSLDDIDALPKFLTRKFLPEGEYHDVEVVAVDSVQGRGLSANASRKYSALYEFASLARAQGLVTVLVGHITKNGMIAGPKNLEHNVDCILHIRRGFRLRLVSVEKNRFGPDVLDPIVLVMDDRGRLVKAPLSSATRTAVFGFSGVGDEAIEVQASVSVPKYGSRPELLAPFLPEKRIRQLLCVLNTLPGIEFTDLSYHVSCYLPRQQRYCGELDLALSIALLSSYLQQPPPPDTLFVGELDLRARIRPPEKSYVSNLGSFLLGTRSTIIRKICVSREAAPQLSRFQLKKDGPRLGDVVEVIGVTHLQDVLAVLWPHLMADSKSVLYGQSGSEPRRDDSNRTRPLPTVR